ncbi:hypothetical protein GCWU000342_00674 [Shuttleworthella satelles DSM 14600]|uniref:Uncharacterized protein n=1 Tax=Shuttleworthella satelles DSM 14600 TaxID=626523 RepID=C4G9M1_9FIRM|nr:hypothetical protein GCWU000342_00674 [Shuttleworthia satelles DSM 14600]
MAQLPRFPTIIHDFSSEKPSVSGIHLLFPPNRIPFSKALPCPTIAEESFQNSSCRIKNLSAYAMRSVHD